MLRYAVIIGAVLACVSAQVQSAPSHRYLPAPPPKWRKAVGVLGHGNATGTIYFEETADGILVTGTILNLTAGKHGFHVHGLGDLSNGCTSTGGHFNPTNQPHGAQDASVRHVGDLGNIEADETGTAQVHVLDKVIALNGANNIIGRAILVHQDEDDLGQGGHNDSLTTGHAGARIGCGVIGIL